MPHEKRDSIRYKSMVNRRAAIADNHQRGANVAASYRSIHVHLGNAYFIVLST